VNKVVETKASRETAPPTSDGLAADQKNDSKSAAAANDDAAQASANRDPVEEVQDQAHPFN